MALVIENGSGVPGADSWVTVAECEAWHLKYSGHALSGSPADKEAAIRRATLFLTTYFAESSSLSGFGNRYIWKGVKTFGRGQTLAWPRTGVEDGEGNEIGANEIPEEVKIAVHVLAKIEFQNPGALTPTVTMTEAVRREQVGPLSVEYFGATTPGEGLLVTDFRPEVTQAIDALKGLLFVNTPYPAALVV